MPTYRDYSWLQPYRDGSLALGYCVAAIPGASPAQVLDTLGAAHVTEAIGIAELSGVALDLAEQSDVPGPSDVVAVAMVDEENTLLLQLNGGTFAVTDELMLPLLPDREVASHYLSVNADSEFVWWSNGERVAYVELFGSNPVVGDERLVDLILDVGGIGIADDASSDPGEHAVEGAFALAERITGVAVPAALFEAGVFSVAVVPRDRRTTSPDPHTLPEDNNPSSWSAVAHRYWGADRTPLHAVITKIRSRGRPGAQLEFWYKPRSCIRLADQQGTLYLRNRQLQTWFRTDGTLQRRSSGYSLDIYLEQLLLVHLSWPSTRFTDLLPPDMIGDAVQVNGRPAWEFAMPPDGLGLDSTVAFDAQTGIPLRWVDKSFTLELSDVETDIRVDDDFFTGP